MLGVHRRPRTRGDAPISGNVQSCPGWSAPHPRGCSAGLPRSCLAYTVGPAPAGMLRPRLSGACPHRRRPRTRGDAPWTHWRSAFRPRSAPHPRGCSESSRIATGDDLVGPAPAGMLRSRGQTHRPSTRRPRTRGDAPRFPTPMHHDPTSAPHPRGCSGVAHCLFPPGGVGPAPAGMLRQPTCQPRSPCRRPRTRGDAPHGAYGPGGRAESAPHPRGCSGNTAKRWLRPWVGPAPAGMLRCGSWQRRWAPGRPRTRGDAPFPTTSVYEPALSAPHPRGCSVA
ncbi:hypothetical protein B591_30913 (plasmid) [Streptomyces sp. GBA 94-10 4N24]|nr:hypothetical protein B591_30913 [Streptomyces sp. GBA 94-10 4N24]UZN63162.1 hypothetical protein B591N_30913 [Streptomyces sp. GBA 94-10 4N24]